MSMYLEQLNERCDVKSNLLSEAKDPCRELREFTLAELRRVKDRIDMRMNDLLVSTKPGCDDSLHGINEAWDVVREAMLELLQ